MYENAVDISVPYGHIYMHAKVDTSSLAFKGEMKQFTPLRDLKKTMLEKLEHPIGCHSLKNEIRKNDKILILIDDNTRDTPISRILPILIDYITENIGVELNNIEIMIANGTHRIMKEKEIIQKVGEEIYKKFKIYQHNFMDKNELLDLGMIEIDHVKFPVLVNKKVREVDYIIGMGNIIPHSDAGFSGGAKIIQPGICGALTTSATHISGALMKEIPLGNVADNICRKGMEEVAKKVGLKFIVNVVMTTKGEIVDIFTGDFIKAHRQGSKLSAQVYGTIIPELADIVVVSSNPCNIDYWQAEKGLVSGYFCVKQGGYIIFVAPCYEGMEHNHPKLRNWAKFSYKEAETIVRETSLEDDSIDLVAADIAMANARIREKAKILIITEGMSDKDISILGYKRFKNLQGAIDYALRENPNSKIGILPRGGDCLPHFNFH